MSRIQIRSLLFLEDHPGNQWESCAEKHPFFISFCVAGLTILHDQYPEGLFQPKKGPPSCRVRFLACSNAALIRPVCNRAAERRCM